MVLNWFRYDVSFSIELIESFVHSVEKQAIESIDRYKEQKETHVLEEVPEENCARIVEKLKLLEDNLQGDVKKLTNYAPEYRMRIGDWRILFELEGEKIIVYRIRHRREAYNGR